MMPGLIVLPLTRRAFPNEPPLPLTRKELPRFDSCYACKESLIRGPSNDVVHKENFATDHGECSN